MEMKEYRIEGIRNRFYWDGGDRVLVEHLATGKMRSFHYHTKTKRYLILSITTDSGQQRTLSKGRILVLLRTGCSLEQLQNCGCQISQHGHLIDSNHCSERNLKRRDVFRTLEEIDEVVDIIKSLNRGDSLPFYLRMEKNRDYLYRLAAHRFGIKAATFNLYWDEAVTAVEEKLRELRMRSFKKPEYYVLSSMRDILYRRGQHTERQLKRMGHGGEG